MDDHKIGGLPVMRGDMVVGIVTESDLFKVFLEVFGARQKSATDGAGPLLQGLAGSDP